MHIRLALPTHHHAMRMHNSEVDENMKREWHPVSNKLQFKSHFTWMPFDLPIRDARCQNRVQSQHFFTDAEECAHLEG